MGFLLTVFGITFCGYALFTHIMVKRGLLGRTIGAAVWNSVFWALLAGLVSAIVLFGRPRPPLDAYFSLKIGSAVMVAVLAGLAGFLCRFRKTQQELYRLLGINREWSETLAVSVLLAAFVMQFVVQSCRIPVPAMKPALNEGDRFFVNRAKYGFRVPFTGRKVLRFAKVQKGNVVAFLFPDSRPDVEHCGLKLAGREIIGRVIARGGDIVEVAGGELLVNGQSSGFGGAPQELFPRPAVTENTDDYQALWAARGLDGKYGPRVRDWFGPVAVPQNSYFVVNDNPEMSCDSRFWGPVPDENIKGSAMLVFWPPAHAGRIK